MAPEAPRSWGSAPSCDKRFGGWRTGAGAPRACNRKLNPGRAEQKGHSGRGRRGGAGGAGREPRSVSLRLRGGACERGARSACGTCGACAGRGPRRVRARRCVCAGQGLRPSAQGRGSAGVGPRRVTGRDLRARGGPASSVRAREAYRYPGGGRPRCAATAWVSRSLPSIDREVSFRAVAGPRGKAPRTDGRASFSSAGHATGLRAAPSSTWPPGGVEKVQARGN